MYLPRTIYIGFKLIIIQVSLSKSIFCWHSFLKLTSFSQNSIENKQTYLYFFKILQKILNLLLHFYTKLFGRFAPIFYFNSEHFLFVFIVKEK